MAGITGRTGAWRSRYINWPSSSVAEKASEMDKLRYGQLDQASLIFCFSLVVAGPINQPSHTSCASLLSLSRITIGDSRQMVALSLCNHICDGATILKSCLATNRGYGSVVRDIRGISSDYSGGTKCCHNLVCSGCHQIPPTRCHRKHVYCICGLRSPCPRPSAALKLAGVNQHVVGPGPGPAGLLMA